MKLNQLIRVILNLLGIYTIFKAIVTSGLSVILIPVTLFYQGVDGLGPIGISLAVVFFQCLLPVTLGILLVWKSRKLADLVLGYSGVDVETGADALEVKAFPFVAFSLLGLYMLSQTLPPFFEFIAFLFQQKLQATAMLATVDAGFLERHLQDIVYHVSTVGFSLLVFMKGKSFGELALSLKQRG